MQAHTPRSALAEYIAALVKGWWLLVVGLVSGVAFLSDYFAKDFGYKILIPKGVFLIVALGALFVAQFLAFMEMRRQRNEARSSGNATHDLAFEALKARYDGLRGEHLQLTQRVEALQASQPRQIDLSDGIRAVSVLRDTAWDDLRGHHIRIYPIPTVHDSAMVAAQIRGFLEHIGSHPHVGDESYNLRDEEYYAHLANGLWVLGNAEGRAERGLATMLRTLGFPVVTIVNLSPPYDGFDIFVVVGNDGKDAAPARPAPSLLR